MKNLVFIATLLCSSFSLAESAYDQSEYSNRAHNWSCYATGFDPRTQQYKSIPGDTKPTLKEAQDSAVISCVAFGYMGCQYSTCMDL